ncbi:Similar to Abt1: Activator of basal transcription 1 (Rattus norvegicus) [Cotesia congregata]|uniref:Activator of basal transcription 1 n=1 Tax=Cotesia congregata TaxID=51543 RepID=A0A8J2H8A8_COTCN|nr:Similar to Abt1: Activator of basal transcription 1 (Rattus norvegicus) [Cotesia congregata]
MEDIESKNSDDSQSEFLNKEVDDNEEKKNVNKKKKKPGIVYLSQIPKYMNCAILKNLLSVHGEIGRVYLQLAPKDAPRIFTEGWVEFESKRAAKFVANNLNGQAIGTRKGRRFYDILWNIKYLPRFKWIHLSERLAYEKAVHKQRLRTEISQAKRESTFFSYNLDRSKKLKLKEQKGEISNFVVPEIKQRETEMEIVEKKKKNKKQNNMENDRKTFLKSIF